MNSDARIVRLLLRWQQLRKQGRAPSVEELCTDCPELREAVGAEIEALASREALLAHTGRPAPPPPKPPPTRRDPPADAPGRSTGSRATPYDANLEETLHTITDQGVPATLPPGPPALRGYRLLQKLGGGTFGVVYKALSSGGVEVAIKEIRYSLGHPQSKRELDALELIKGLRHPYLLALHDFWVENDRLYMAMELADSTLTQRAREQDGNRIPQPELLQIFAEAAETLDFLHLHRVLHRDIKPANILLLRGHAKVADLGLAKFNPDEVAVSQTVAGTPAYMAPESFKNEFRPESDQYALALCYAELRLGRLICEGTNTPAVIAWHLYATPDLQGLQSHEEQAIRRALSKNPGDRFPSCQDFVRALVEPPPRPRRWRNGWPVLALLLAVPVLAVVLWRLLPARPENTDAPPPPPPPPLQVDWAPEEFGFFAPPDAPITSVGARRYYDRVAKKIGGGEVMFQLIPRGSEGPQTFYMMENKVSNGLFKAAAADAEFQNQLARLRQEYPAMKWDEWPRGGVRNGKVDVTSENDDLPVLRVNVMEAYCFARWIGGNLPTEDQWNRAAGKGSGAKAIFLDPDAPLLPGDVAVNRRAEGPMPVGTARRDLSPLHCRDMAGNGMEWTRNLDSGGSIPPRSPGEDLLVTVRGRSYYHKDPFDFNFPPDWRPFKQGDPAVGFRVVVEP